MPLLRGENLSKSFGAQAAVRGVSLEINRGEIFVVMGLSGSGKSTLLRMLNGLIHPSQGDVQVDGQWLSQLSGQELRELRRSQMAMVFQSFALFPNRTALENACFGLEIAGVSASQRRERARLALERVGLGEALHKRPHELSGGMQQRVGLARALALDPPILLMDEAFSALDPLIRREMQDLLLELQKELEKTIIFITHDLDEALKLADHLVILKDGAIVQQGEPQHILLNPCDPYIEDFVSDINRARVLRVRSVMSALTAEQFDGDIEAGSTLERLISMSDGDTNHVYRVMQDGEAVGQLDMKDLVKALVPRSSSNEGARVA